MESEDKEVKVRFCRNRQTPKHNQVVIFPDSNSWNDFGYRISCLYVAKLDNYEEISGSLFLGFLTSEDYLGEEKPSFEKKATGLQGLFDDFYPDDSEFELDSKEVRFYTLHHSIQEYRILVDRLGPDRSNQLLNSLNDLVVHKSRKESSKWVTEAIETKCFKLAFMRNSEPFFAFHNAESVLDGVEQEDLKRISTTLSLDFKLDGFTNKHQLKFKYSSKGVIPKRINVLIGKNGLGKSLALTNFCRAALRYKDKDNKLTDPERSDERPMISRILAIGTPGETSNTFPQERKKTQKLFYRRLILTRNSRASTSRRIGETLVQLARSEEGIGTYSRWELFLNALEKILPREEIVITLSDGSHLSLDKLGSSNVGNAPVPIFGTTRDRTNHV